MFGPTGTIRLVFNKPGSKNRSICSVYAIPDPAGPVTATAGRQQQQLDAHDNPQWVKMYGFAPHGQFGTLLRTYTNTYLADPNYTSRFIFNRLLTSTVTNGANTVTLVSNGYDAYYPSPPSSWFLQNTPGVREHDSNYNAGSPYRGARTGVRPTIGRRAAEPLRRSGIPPIEYCGPICPDMRQAERTGGLNIQVRIWSSIAIFVLGFMISVLAGQVERAMAEHSLEAVSGALLPASRDSSEAVASFQRLVKAYSDVVLIEDRSGLERADVEGARVMESIRRIRVAKGILQARIAAASHLADTIPAFLAAANTLYGEISPNLESLTPELQMQLRHMAERTTSLRVQLESLDTGFQDDLRQTLATLRTRSARMRTFALTWFTVTLAIATVLVNIRIRRSILAPLAKTQSELTHERDLLRILLDHVPDCIYFKDAASRFIRINKALAALLGLSEPQRACGTSDADYFSAETARQAYADEQRILATGQPLIAKMEEISCRGVTRWMMSTKVPVLNGTPDGNLIVGISRDITSWKKTLEELQRSEESFRLLFAAIPHAVWVYEVESLRLLAVNDAAYRQYLFTPAEFAEMTVLDLHAPEDRARWQSRRDRRLSARTVGPAGAGGIGRRPPPSSGLARSGSGARRGGGGLPGGCSCP